MQAQMRQAMPKRYFCPVRSTSVSVTNSLIGAQLNTPSDLAALCTPVLSIKAGRSTQMSYAPCGKLLMSLLSALLLRFLRVTKIRHNPQLCGSHASLSCAVLHTFVVSTRHEKSCNNPHLT